MPVFRTLNPIDIIRFKKDFLWGKSHFAAIEGDKLLQSLLFAEYCQSQYVTELLKVEISNNSELNSDLIKHFIEGYSQKTALKYFYAEFDEITESPEIALVREHGFKRFNRNLYFTYLKAKQEFSKTSVQIFCRSAELFDLEQILEIEHSCQLLEYRDYFYRSEQFLKEQIISDGSQIYVIVDANNRERIYAFACKHTHSEHCFEIVLHDSMSDLMSNCIDVFAEHYIQFDKFKQFSFSVKESHNKDVLNELKKIFPLEKTTQLLLLATQQKKKSLNFNWPLTLKRTRTA